MNWTGSSAPELWGVSNERNRRHGVQKQSRRTPESLERLKAAALANPLKTSSTPLELLQPHTFAVYGIATTLSPSSYRHSKDADIRSHPHCCSR